MQYMKASSKTTWIFLLCLFLLVSLACICGGTGLLYEKDLGNGYAVWAVDIIEEACVMKKIDSDSAVCKVPPTVFEYGWDERYIVAKQYAQKNYYEVDTTKVNWFIVDMKNDEVYGPMTESEYLDTRETLSVPTELDFTVELEIK